MKLIELHILQSFPVSCLNRDDVGSPKSAVFGGVQRARISSQCLKRASRVLAHENHAGFEGIRSRHLLLPFTEALSAAGLDADAAAKQAEALCVLFSKKDSKHPEQVTTAVYLSPGEIQQIATAIAGGEDAKKAIKNATRTDAADIALFGRMIANDPNLNVEGASMFSHALSTHKTNNEVDFFSAVDDRKGDAEDAGAGMIGSLEFNSATYYRYVAINLDLLAAPTHLGGLSEDERKDILRAFIKSALTAVPNARKNSMNAGTLPHEVLGIRKEKGQPLQLINAFEKPVSSRGQGFAAASLDEMKAHLASIEKVWGAQGEQHFLTETDGGLDAFIDQLLKD
ncbi:type I-E CRISPR-associated protein Cas7/Cse4/CasC [Coraliomargarita sp. SDUM461003]|uniref:Type I-E CRISPR-associated protein Cas7/Cse4/CasC n=1 Tax=Thalassobacterium maritimum TaxID=3041265 RepID=A0ABU1AZB7_9BACT|nr:type I-E CRISPR-associated protein Cas7/Cse4/CasC [Coraliomargarita sp. SDUM461003]MDQ8209472.1 type I-E CRISPR-associated protein Cas7/Cse4/CasC [Coraliomargarita sp. SDUM461003]